MACTKNYSFVVNIMKETFEKPYRNFGKHRNLHNCSVYILQL